MYCAPYINSWGIRVLFWCKVRIASLSARDNQDVIEDSTTTKNVCVFAIVTSVRLLASQEAETQDIGVSQHSVM
jgi:hypothetical protein